MSLQYRPTRPEDIPTLLQMIAEHPILGKRFGPHLQSLTAAVALTTALDSVHHVSLEERTPDGHFRLLGAGFIGFVTDEFAAQAKTPPYFWIGPEVTTLTTRGKTPFLSDSELRKANSTGGLNTITWIYVVDVQQMQRFEVQKLAMDAYCANLSGYQLKQIIGQVAVVQELDAALQSGGLLLSEDGTVSHEASRPLEQIVAEPHIFVMTQDLVNRYLGTWTSLLFMYHPPVFAFSSSEQRLLEAALRGLTDEDLASELQISLSAVKKTWRSIYSRVESSGAGILPASVEEHETGDRGKGKKHRLLAYVREHPEEFRPVSMKLLRKSQARTGGDPSFTHPNGSSQRVSGKRSATKETKTTLAGK